MITYNGATLDREQQQAVVDWLGERRLIPSDALVRVLGCLAFYTVYVTEGRLADWWIRVRSDLPRLPRVRLVLGLPRIEA